MIFGTRSSKAVGASRTRSLGTGLLAIMVMGVVLLPAARAAPSLDSEELAFCQLINNHRAQYGLQPLQASPTLNSAADWFSTDMANKNYAPSNHIDSLGRDPVQRMLDFGYPATSTQTAENIAGGNSTALETFNQWRGSPGHNANMLAPDLAVIGIGRAFNSASLYDWYWTTDFGGLPDGGTTPCSSSTTPSPAPTTTPSPAPTTTPSPAPTTTPSPAPTTTPSPAPTTTPSSGPTTAPSSGPTTTTTTGPSPTLIALATTPAIWAKQSVVNSGGVLQASWSGVQQSSPYDWIGLYPSSGTPNYGDIAWRYTNGASSGTVSLKVPPGTPPGTTYELRLFRDDTYSRLATSEPLTVVQATVSAFPLTVGSGGVMEVSWSGVVEPSPYDWLGLYTKGTCNYCDIAWRPTTGESSGTVRFRVPPETPPGTTYEIRLFRNNTYSRLATSEPLTVD